MQVWSLEAGHKLGSLAGSPHLPRLFTGGGASFDERRVPAPLDTADPPLTPLYDSLTTNSPHPTMCFVELPFPSSTAVYPSAKWAGISKFDSSIYYLIYRRSSSSTRRLSVRN